MDREEMLRRGRQKLVKFQKTRRSGTHTPSSACSSTEGENPQLMYESTLSSVSEAIEPCINQQTRLTQQQRAIENGSGDVVPRSLLLQDLNEVERVISDVTSINKTAKTSLDVQVGERLLANSELSSSSEFSTPSMDRLQSGVQTQVSSVLIPRLDTNNEFKIPMTGISTNFSVMLKASGDHLGSFLEGTSRAVSNRADALRKSLADFGPIMNDQPLNQHYHQTGRQQEKLLQQDQLQLHDHCQQQQRMDFVHGSTDNKVGTDWLTMTMNHGQFITGDSNNDPKHSRDQFYSKNSAALYDPGVQDVERNREHLNHEHREYLPDRYKFQSLPHDENCAHRETASHAIEEPVGTCESTASTVDKIEGSHASSIPYEPFNCGDTVSAYSIKNLDLDSSQVNDLSVIQSFSSDRHFASGYACTPNVTAGANLDQLNPGNHMGESKFHERNQCVQELILNNSTTLYPFGDSASSSSIPFSFGNSKSNMDTYPDFPTTISDHQPEYEVLSRPAYSVTIASNAASPNPLFKTSDQIDLPPPFKSLTATASSSGTPLKILPPRPAQPALQLSVSDSVNCDFHDDLDSYGFPNYPKSYHSGTASSQLVNSPSGLGNDKIIVEDAVALASTISFPLVKPHSEIPNRVVPSSPARPAAMDILSSPFRPISMFPDHSAAFSPVLANNVALITTESILPGENIPEQADNAFFHVMPASIYNSVSAVQLRSTAPSPSAHFNPLDGSITAAVTAAAPASAIPFSFNVKPVIPSRPRSTSPEKKHGSHEGSLKLSDNVMTLSADEASHQEESRSGGVSVSCQWLEREEVRIAEQKALIEQDRTVIRLRELDLENRERALLSAEADARRMQNELDSSRFKVEREAKRMEDLILEFESERKLQQEMRQAANSKEDIRLNSEWAKIHMERDALKEKEKEIMLMWDRLDDEKKAIKEKEAIIETREIEVNERAECVESDKLLLSQELRDVEDKEALLKSAKELLDSRRRELDMASAAFKDYRAREEKLISEKESEIITTLSRAKTELVKVEDERKALDDRRLSFEREEMGLLERESKIKAEELGLKERLKLLNDAASHHSNSLENEVAALREENKLLSQQLSAQKNAVSIDADASKNRITELEASNRRLQNDVLKLTSFLEGQRIERKSPILSRSQHIQSSQDASPYANGNFDVLEHLVESMAADERQTRNELDTITNTRSDPKRLQTGGMSVTSDFNTNSLHSGEKKVLVSNSAELRKFERSDFVTTGEGPMSDKSDSDLLKMIVHLTSTNQSLVSKLDAALDKLQNIASVTSTSADRSYASHEHFGPIYIPSASLKTATLKSVPLTQNSTSKRSAGVANSSVILDKSWRSTIDVGNIALSGNQDRDYDWMRDPVSSNMSVSELRGGYRTDGENSRQQRQRRVRNDQKRKGSEVSSAVNTAVDVFKVAPDVDDCNFDSGSDRNARSIFEEHGSSSASSRYRWQSSGGIASAPPPVSGAQAAFSTTRQADVKAQGQLPSALSPAAAAYVHPVPISSSRSAGRGNRSHLASSSSNSRKKSHADYRNTIETSDIVLPRAVSTEGLRSYFTDDDISNLSEATRNILFGKK